MKNWSNETSVYRTKRDIPACSSAVHLDSERKGWNFIDFNQPIRQIRFCRILTSETKYIWSNEMVAINDQNLYLFHLSHHGSHLDVYSIMNPNLSLLCHTISSTFDHFCLEYPCVSWANSSLTARIANSLHHLTWDQNLLSSPKT
jgi:hypothetical protein